MILLYEEYQKKLKTHPIENWLFVDLTNPYPHTNIPEAFQAAKKFSEDISVLKLWIKTNIESDVFVYATYKFAFEDPDDGLIFKLRFG